MQKTKQSSGRSVELATPKGRAADIFVPNTETAMRYGHILEQHSAVQQLLLEPLGAKQKRWIHVI